MSNINDFIIDDDGMLEYIQTVKNSNLYLLSKEYSDIINDLEQTQLKKIRIKKLNIILNDGNKSE